ncbi:MAG: flavin reductase [Ruminococcus sp.]|jgi:flavin reductase (DIM6/NTAB) family NADH-FMN oxidoreductase RutF
MGFQKKEVKDIEKNVFRMIGDEWMLVSAKKDGKVNTMTVSWGGMGILWGKEVATVYIRPQRYTKEFIDGGEMFTLSFFGGEYKKELGYLGKVSGRDEDKIKAVDFHVEMVEDQPAFAESELVLVCRKLYEDKIKPELFKEAWIDEKWYPDKDYHTMYIAEIVGAYSK